MCKQQEVTSTLYWYAQMSAKTTQSTILFLPFLLYILMCKIIVEFVWAVWTIYCKQRHLNAEWSNHTKHIYFLEFAMEVVCHRTYTHKYRHTHTLNFGALGIAKKNLDTFHVFGNINMFLEMAFDMIFYLLMANWTQNTVKHTDFIIYHVIGVDTLCLFLESVFDWLFAFVCISSYVLINVQANFFFFFLR